MSWIAVRPSATTVQAGSGVFTEQSAPSSAGSTRQTCDEPGRNGNPFSSPTYAQPSGPIATVVGTASVVSVGGKPGGRWSVEIVSRSKRATVVTSPDGVTRSRSLFAASVTSASPEGSAARPYGFDSVANSS